MPIEIRGLVVGHCIRSLCQAKRYAIAEQLSSEEHLSIFRRTIMTNINLFMVLAGGAAVAICAVLIQLCDLPLWLLPGVMALSGLIDGATNGDNPCHCRWLWFLGFDVW
jgi:hypothetical protein